VKIRTFEFEREAWFLEFLSNKPHFKYVSYAYTEDSGNTFLRYCVTPSWQPNYATPQPNYATPQPNYATPQPNYATPQPNYATPQPNYATPQPRN